MPDLKHCRRLQALFGRCVVPALGIDTSSSALGRRSQVAARLLLCFYAWVEADIKLAPEDSAVEQNAHHGSHLFYISCAIVVLSAVGMRAYVARQVAKVRESYRLRQEENMMQFCKPLALQKEQWTAFWFLTLVGFGVTIAASQTPRNPSLVYVSGFVSLGLSLVLLYLCGPDDIRLDGKQRTYERTVGWPWKPTTRFGPFSDVKGVCISPRNTVLLLMKKPDFMKSSGAIVLSSYGASQTACALIEELNRAYGFPVVPYPKNV